MHIQGGVIHIRGARYAYDMHNNAYFMHTRGSGRPLGILGAALYICGEALCILLCIRLVRLEYSDYDPLYQFQWDFLTLVLRKHRLPPPALPHEGFQCLRAPHTEPQEVHLGPKEDVRDSAVIFLLLPG